jgi:hypothetical protein
VWECASAIFASGYEEEGEEGIQCMGRIGAWISPIEIWAIWTHGAFSSPCAAGYFSYKLSFAQKKRLQDVTLSIKFVETNNIYARF